MYLSDLIESKNAKSGLSSPTGEFKQIPFAGEVLLEKLFSAYKFTPSAVKHSTLCDVYNINNPVTWSGTEYKDFPPWAKIEEIEKHLGGLKFTEVISRGSEPLLDSMRASSHVDEVAEVVRAAQSELDSPAGATTSWIE